MVVTSEYFDLREAGDVTVVTLTDRHIMLDEQIRILGSQLYELVDRDGRIKVLIGFGEVEFMSCSFFGKLITFQKKISARGGKLVLCQVCPAIHEVFVITKIIRLFDIRTTEAEGLSAF